MELKENIAIAANLTEDPNPVHEKAISQMRTWLSQIYPDSQVDRALEIIKPSSLEESQELRLRAKIWTCNNEFSIVARVTSGTGINVNRNMSAYLGCQASSRKSRTGENWSRGNDLADGGFCKETWNRILVDIVRYEVEEVKSEKWKEE